jgi:hypothetical protein
MIKQTVVSDNLVINTRNLFEYDTVLCATIKGMPSNSQDTRKHIKEWATETLEIVKTYNLVVRCVPVLYEGYYLLNDLYHFGANQSLLVKRNGFWSWRSGESIIESDYIFIGHKEQQVAKIKQVKERCTIFVIETACSDIVYINDVLVYSGVTDAN